MLEILREDNALYKWRIGKTANHMGYVKSNENDDGRDHLEVLHCTTRKS
jgi:hypothetical protein